MTKLRTTLLAASLLALLTHIEPAEPFFIVPGLNCTNTTTNGTYHAPAQPHPTATATKTQPKGPYHPISLDPTSKTSSAAAAGETNNMRPDDGNDDDDGPYFSRAFNMWEDRLCGASSYVNNTASTSALTADCRRLADDFLTERHGWISHNFKNNHTLLSIRHHGTCGFGIRPHTAEDIATRNNTGWFVGSRDIARFVHHAADEFSAASRMGATGLTHCEKSGNIVDVQWSVYGPGELEKVGWNWAAPIPTAGGGKNAASSLLASIAAMAWLVFFW